MMMFRSSSLLVGIVPGRALVKNLVEVVLDHLLPGFIPDLLKLAFWGVHDLECKLAYQ